MIYTLIAMCLVVPGMYFLLFVAPHMPKPVNKCRAFILVGKNKPETEDHHAPWWLTPLVLFLMFLGQIWPAFGFTMLGLLVLSVGLIKLMQTYLVIRSIKNGRSK